MGYQQTYALYASTSDFWQFALPPDTLFCDGGIEGGAFTAPVLTGTSSGSILVDLASNPRDDFLVVIKCVSAGELNVDGVINAGAPPTFAISLDNGVTYSLPLSPESLTSKTFANGTNVLDYQRGGFRLLLTNGAMPSSFVLNDTWRFSTTASPSMVRALSAACRSIDSYIVDTYTLPLQNWSDDTRYHACQLARWFLIRRRGLHQQSDMTAYDPKESMDWLDLVSKGRIQPILTERGPAYLFPDVVVTRHPYRTDWHY